MKRDISHVFLSNSTVDLDKHSRHAVWWPERLWGVVGGWGGCWWFVFEMEKTGSCCFSLAARGAHKLWCVECVRTSEVNDTTEPNLLLSHFHILDIQYPLSWCLCAAFYGGLSNITVIYVACVAHSAPAQNPGCDWWRWQKFTRSSSASVVTEKLKQTCQRGINHTFSLTKVQVTVNEWSSVEYKPNHCRTVNASRGKEGINKDVFSFSWLYRNNWWVWKDAGFHVSVRLCENRREEPTWLCGTGPCSLFSTSSGSNLFHLSLVASAPAVSALTQVCFFSSFLSI